MCSLERFFPAYTQKYDRHAAFGEIFLQVSLTIALCIILFLKI